MPQQIEGFEQMVSDRIYPVVARLGYFCGIYEPSKTPITVPVVIVKSNGVRSLLHSKEERRYGGRVCGKGEWA